MSSRESDRHVDLSASEVETTAAMCCSLQYPLQVSPHFAQQLCPGSPCITMSLYRVTLLLCRVTNTAKHPFQFSQTRRGCCCVCWKDAGAGMTPAVSVGDDLDSCPRSPLTLLSATHRADRPVEWRICFSVERLGCF